MARISKYANFNTEKSEQKIKTLRSKASLTLSDIETFQNLYGISDALLAQAIGVDKSVISRYKKEQQSLPEPAIIALYLFMKNM